MHTERKANLAAVMEIMLNEMPDNPLPCDDRRLAVIVVARIGLLPVGRRPAGDRFLHALPRSLQAVDQFVSTASWHPLAIPGTQIRKLLAAFAHQLIEPARPSADHMSRNVFDGTEGWGHAQC